jgi:Fe-S-cluster-containing hydrogenase component 2
LYSKIFKLTFFGWRIGLASGCVAGLLTGSAECIDCGVCVPVCPVTAIFAQEDLPEKWQAYTETNENYVDGGKFQLDKYQKASS